MEEQSTGDVPSGGDVSCALFFPADYSVGMSNLGYHYIYRRLAELRVNVERFFALPIPYRSVESDTLLERFPIILASISFEGDLPLVIDWLRSGGIDPSRRKRPGRAPIVGAGGAITYINPLPLCGICDFIVLGDGLPVLDFLAETLKRARSKEEALERLAEHPSILVPRVHIDRGIRGRLETSKSPDISAEYGHGLWVTPRTTFGGTLLVELQRGCFRRCAYCALPNCFKPPRQRDVESVKRDIMAASVRCDFSQVGLVTPEAGDYGDLNDLLSFLESSGYGVSFASLRVDNLTERAVRALARGGRHSVTIAPESGDDELRAACGKRFTNKDIIEKMSMAREHGIIDVKLYFMIGLPGEGDRHIASIADLCGKLRNATGQNLTAGVSPFVPKPGSEWEEMDFAGEREIKRRYSLMSRSLKGLRGIKLRSASARGAGAEYALAWADSEASERLAMGVPLKDAVSEVKRNSAARELERLRRGVR
ncbi:MAG: B12-binding domain-containing radical SAM protein [Synergistaceae bacterium]|nr:B12-binding domain-containing radical SAM protein [Synergistaceae bacterium]